MNIITTELQYRSTFFIIPQVTYGGTATKIK